MCENVVQWAVGANQLLRRLLADAAHTWHVVRRVANEREIVGDERRRHTEPLASILDAHPLLLDARRASAAWIQQPYAGPHELLKILVARNDNDVQAGGDCFPSQCANDVVSFISAYGDDRDVVSIEKLTNSLHPAIKVRLQLIGKLFARRFVAGVRLVAE